LLLIQYNWSRALCKERERDYPICLRHWPSVNCKVLTSTQPLEPYLHTHVHLVIIPLVLSRYGRTYCSYSPRYYTLNVLFAILLNQGTKKNTKVRCWRRGPYIHFYTVHNLPTGKDTFCASGRGYTGIHHPRPQICSRLFI
jgi:hypothetical protein